MKIRTSTLAQITILIGTILLGFSIYNYFYGGAHYDESLLYMILPTRWHIYLPTWILYSTLISAGLTLYKHHNLSYFLFLIFGTIQLSLGTIRLISGGINEIDSILSVLTIYGFINSRTSIAIEIFELEDIVPIWKPICIGILIIVLSFGIQII